MGKKMGLIQLVMLVMFFLNVGYLHVSADDGMPVSVNAVLPENQHDKTVTYYDLRMKPGEQQELDFELTNSSAKDEKVKIEINNGTTNDTGSLDYSNRGENYQRDNTLKIAMTDVATMPAEVIVKGNSKTTVKLKLAMPVEEFDGIVIGGIRVSLAEEPQEKATSTEGGMAIKNKIAYTVGITLSETDKEVSAELDLLEVFAGQTAGRNVVKANIQNSEAQVLEEITYDGYITEKGKSAVLHQSEGTGYRFAPNSNFNYDISWGNQAFKAGEYTLHLSAASKASGQKWNWTKEFQITATEAKNLNQTAIDVDQDHLLNYIIIGLVLIIVVIVLLVMYQQIKNNQAEKRKQALKKKKRKSQ